MGKVRDRFGAMVKFKGGLQDRGRVNNVIIDVVAEINYRCYYRNYYFLNVSTL